MNNITIKILILTGWFLGGFILMHIRGIGKVDASLRVE
jgi:hypothetical protein